VLRDACAVACARALAAPPAAAELCLPLVAPGGRVILWLGQSADPDDVSVAAAALAGELRATTTPGLLVLEKVGPTPDRFPRRPGVAAHRPLR
jgi:16S rRNA (guanine527-N7)-methyltransferase